MKAVSIVVFFSPEGKYIFWNIWNKRKSLKKNNPEPESSLQHIASPLKWQIIYDGGKTTPISTTATSTKKLPNMLLSPNEDLAFTNSFSIPRGPQTYKSYRKDADLQRHSSFSVALQRLIFPDSNNEYGISSINNAEALRSPRS